MRDPLTAVTSLAFVVAAAAVLASGRGRQRMTYAALVALVGVGSFVQHGPHPDWQAYAHDLPIVAVLSFICADAVSDLRGRRLSPLWWVLPTLVAPVAVAAGPAVSTLAQAAVAAAALTTSLLRARLRRRLRPWVAAALLVVAVGAVVDVAARLGGATAEAVGHAIWHVLAALALGLLGVTIGHDVSCRTPPDPGRSDAVERAPGGSQRRRGVRPSA